MHDLETHALLPPDHFTTVITVTAYGDNAFNNLIRGNPDTIGPRRISMSFLVMSHVQRLDVRVFVRKTANQYSRCHPGMDQQAS